MTLYSKNRTRGKRQQRALRRRWIMIGGLVALVAVSVVAFLALRPPKVEGVQTLDDQGNDHLAQAPSGYIWNSRPPTSGPHSSQIAAWGEHAESVPEWYQVHNLEDGGVIMHYNCPDGCPEIVAELRAILDDMGEENLILHPYANMDSRIALTAWTHLLALDEVDRDRIEAFIKAYRGLDHHR